MSYKQFLFSVLSVIFLFTKVSATEGTLDSLQLLLDKETDIEKKYVLYSEYVEELIKTDRSKTVPFNHQRLDIAKTLSESSKISECYRSLGNNFLFVNNNDSAYYYYNLALPIYEEAKDTGMIATVLNNVALIQQRSNNYEEAIKTYHEVIETSYKHKKYNTSIGALINVASLQLNQENEDFAVEYLLRAESIYNEIPQDSTELLEYIQSYFLPSLYVNLGVAYETKQPTNSENLYVFDVVNHIDSSIFYFNKAITSTEDIDNDYNATYIKSYVLENKAAINYRKEEWNQAYVNFKTALEGFELINNNQGAVFSKVDIGDVLTKIGRYEEAQKYLIDGLNGAIEFGITEKIRDAYENLAENAKARKDYKSSIDYFEKHLSYKDSLMSKERTNAIQEMETKYETERIEQEKILAEKETAIAEQQQKQQLIFFLLGLLGVIAASVMGYSRYKFKQQQKVAKYERSINEAMSKFVPNEFIESIGRDKITDVQLGDMKEKELTVVFTDIRNFTSRSEKLTPTELFTFVKDYAQAMGPIIQKNGGFINQYLGDGLMAIFQTSPEDALKACIEMQERLITYNDELLKKGHEIIRVGMGLHTGPAVMGIIGDNQRKDAAMLSDTINTAARMESKTKQFGVKILISGESKRGLKNPENYQLRQIGNVTVKGKEKPINVYECYNPDNELLKKDKMASLEKFDEAVNAFMNQEFIKADKLFNHIIENNPNDLVSKSFVNQINEINQTLEDRGEIASILMNN